MTALFPTKPGVVAVLYDTSVMPLTINVASTDGMFAWDTAKNMRAILTGVELTGAGAVAVNGTLGERIHIAVCGGERPGMIRLSGLIFAAACDPAGVQVGSPGLVKVLEFYEGVRVSTTGRRVQVAFGGFLVLYGVVVSFREAVADANTGVGQFVIDIPYAPRRPLPGPLAPVQVLSGEALAGAFR